jgi:YhcH/YjgK/YiaL family protein
MRRLIVNFMILTGIFVMFGCTGKSDPSAWNSEKLNKWFDKGDWHKNWSVKPDSSIDRALFAKAWFKNPERWNKAFDFLKNNDLSKLELKRYDVDGDSLFVMVSEYSTKNPADAKYEAHRKYIDIQYVVSGSELIGIAPITSLNSTLQEYDGTKDIEFLTTKMGKMFQATPARFFIFFPEDAHMPGVKVETNTPVRKVVVKVCID